MLNRRSIVSARNSRSALLPCHGIERCRFLLDILATAFRTLHFLLVLLERENNFESLMAGIANVFIHGHGEPPVGKGLPANCSAEIQLRNSGAADGTYFFSAISTLARVFSQSRFIVQESPFWSKPIVKSS